jgi:hypothetical protein
MPSLRSILYTAPGKKFEGLRRLEEVAMTFRILASAICLNCAVVMLSAPAAHAAPLTFTATLSGANENPATPSPGTGQAIVVLDPTAHTLQINVTFSGLTSNDVAAHIHCCIAPPNNTGVATAVPAFPGFPLGVTAGTYNSAVFDLTQSQIYNPAFVTAQGGLAQAEAALENGLENGLTYLNIHTVNFGGGELRGFLAETPLPAALPLFATGLGALGLLGWRRKRTTSALAS